MHAHAGEELDFRRRVRLVGVEVEVDAHVHDGDEFEEVDAKQVRLRAVGLPELRRVGGAQRAHAVAWFRGADGPGGQGGDFFQAGGREGLEVEVFCGRLLAIAVG